MDTLRFTLLTQIVVSTLGAHVPDSCDGGHMTAITFETIMKLARLVGLLLYKILLVERLELVSAESFDLLLHHLDHVTETFKVKLTGSIALTAGKTLVIHLRSFALEAGDVLFHALFIRIRARHDQVALHLLCRVFRFFHLVAAIDSHHFWLSIRPSVFHNSTDLTGRDGSLSTRGNVHIIHLHIFSHDAHLALTYQVSHVSTSILRHRPHIIASDTHFMRDFFILISFGVSHATPKVLVFFLDHG